MFQNNSQTSTSKNKEEKAEPAKVLLHDFKNPHKSRIKNPFEGRYTGSIFSLLFLPSSEMLVSGSEDGTLKVWDTRTWTCLNTLEGHTHHVSCLQPLPDDKVASGSVDHTIKVWDLKTGGCLKTLEGHSLAITCLQMLPSSELVSGSEDGMLKVWDLETGTCLKSVRRNILWGDRCFHLLPNGDLVIGSFFGPIDVMDPKT